MPPALGNVLQQGGLPDLPGPRNQQGWELSADLADPTFQSAVLISAHLRCHFKLADDDGAVESLLLAFQWTILLSGRMP